ncbi:hypothetical protein BOTBODRAFT_152985 [Botryobasidium botryosum FD-172 SS1]|uniref:Transcription initiation factor IIE subunit beta n=1 Tax=Botryobasidium botryosum (strain FD-172 SS1) TaxID=930990 RepID=A0A067N079_BOTB1|nr:hypothetical protein BOTBODRAFT_152985 [Botryobasidium botryosum FD-172 SS1]
MASLQRDRSSFLKKMGNATAPSWGKAATTTAQAQPAAPATTLAVPGASNTSLTYSPAVTPPPAASSSDTGKKKKRPRNDIVYSQPAEKGTGTHTNTQIFYALEYLKKHNAPMRIEDLSIMAQVPIATEPELLSKFKNHNQVIYNPKTDTYAYKTEFGNINNLEALIREIKFHTRKGGGLTIRTLKESWPSAPAAIEDLEKAGKVLVTRTAKDGQAKMVFWNEMPESEGGKAADQEFKDLWHSLTVPAEVDLLRSLASDGLQATMSEALPIKAPVQKKSKKGAKRSRPGKITNTHLVKLGIDLTKDYVAEKK